MRLRAYPQNNFTDAESGTDRKCGLSDVEGREQVVSEQGDGLAVGYS